MPNISGFTFIKNGLSLGYPILESILSISPICDEIVINVGYEDTTYTDDGTFDYLKTHLKDKKYIFLKSIWPQKSISGIILAEQTNIALKACKGEYCLYIQGDECIHENDLEIIKKDIKKLDKNKNIDGLVFNYHHFYGSPQIEKYTRNVYKREIRLIRNHVDIESYLDAQGFRYKNNKKIPSLSTKATYYHYGWARNLEVMRKKIIEMEKLYHKNIPTKNDFNYDMIWGLRKFEGTHPKLMSKWIESNTSPIELKNYLPKSLKELNLMLSDYIEKITGYRIGEYKNFILKKHSSFF